MPLCITSACIDLVLEEKRTGMVLATHLQCWTDRYRLYPAKTLESVQSRKGALLQQLDRIWFFFCIFSGPCRKLAQMAPNAARRIFVPTNPDLADILGRTDLDFENFYIFGYFWFYFLDPTFLDFQVPRSPNFWISRSPDLQIPRFPGS